MSSSVRINLDVEAERLAEAVSKSPRDSLFQVLGSPTAGKSTLLSELKGRLEKRQLVPILVAPPPRASDSAAIALVQVSGALRDAGLGNGIVEVMKDPAVPWIEKLSKVRSTVAQHADQVVLLVDDPMVWSLQGKSPEEFFFGRHTAQVVDLLVQGEAVRRVVAGEMPRGSFIVPERQTRLARTSDAQSWLTSASEWGSLASSAKQLRDVLGGELANYTQLELRLLVALVRLMGAGVVASLRPTFRSRRSMGARLIEQLGTRPDLQDLRQLWAKLELIREPIEEPLLSTLEAGNLTAEARDLLRHCLLFSQGGRWVLHDTLRSDVREPRRFGTWLGIGTQRETHRELALYYQQAFAQAQRSTADRLRCEMEAFFHASSLGDAGFTEQFTAFFVDQLDMLGRAVSQRALRRRPPDEEGLCSAASVFGRAVSWDPTDSYAQHYQAFNLDVTGLNPEKVEVGFREAIRLDPGNVWWRSRLVNFLITRGRDADAEREWDMALDEFGLPDPNASSFVYENMHLWIARLLVHRGLLTFADRVLRGIPASVLREHSGLSAVVRRLDALLQARRTGAFVPAWLLRSRWWSAGPALLPPAIQDGAIWTEWIAARIDEIGEDRLNLHTARLVRGAAEPEYGFLDLSFDDFQRRAPGVNPSTLSAGQFLEIGRYGPEVRIRVHRLARWREPGLPRLFPDPTRYLRRRFSTTS